MFITKEQVKSNFIKQKKLYITLCSLIGIGIILGVVFVFILSDTDKVLVEEQMNVFFNSLNDDNMNYVNGLINSLITNMGYCLGIFLLGISIVGIPVIVFMLFMKGFVLGFSITSIISIYGFSSIPVSFLYVFPVHFISLIISLLLSFYAIKFSARLFSSLFMKREINFKLVMNKYIRVFIIGISFSILNSLIEVFVSPFLMRLVVGFISM